jgi:undecaprenyl pyrophosphate phosphatase UppP
MEALIAVIAGAIVTLLIQLSQKWGISNRFLLAVFVIVAAALYSTYQYFVDDVTKAQVAQFATSTLGSAVIFYEYFVKIIQQQTKSVTEVNKLG